MIDANRLAGQAHHALVQDIIKIQARILQCKALLAEFGPDAVHPMPMLIDRRSVTEGPRNLERSIEDDTDRLAELLEMARQLEAVFADIDAGKMTDLAEFLRQRHGFAAE